MHRTGNLSEAERQYRDALAIQQKLADDNPTVADFRDSLGLSHDNLGLLLLATGKPSEAEHEAREGLAVFQKLADDNRGVSLFRQRLSNVHMNLGWICYQSGKSSEAEAEYRKALAIEQDLADDNPGVTVFRSHVGANSHELWQSALDHGQGHGRGGRVPIRHWYCVRSWPTTTPPSPNIRSGLADVLGAIGWQLAQAGKAAEALGYYTREEAIRAEARRGQLG